MEEQRFKKEGTYVIGQSTDAVRPWRDRTDATCKLRIRCGQQSWGDWPAGSGAAMTPLVSALVAASTTRVNHTVRGSPITTLNDFCRVQGTPQRYRFAVSFDIPKVDLGTKTGPECSAQ